MKLNLEEVNIDENKKKHLQAISQYSCDGLLLLREFVLSTEDRDTIITHVYNCLNLCYRTNFVIIYGSTITNATILVLA